MPTIYEWFVHAKVSDVSYKRASVAVEFQVHPVHWLRKDIKIFWTRIESIYGKQKCVSFALVYWQFRCNEADVVG